MTAAAYYLIVLFFAGSPGPAMTSAPMASLQACEQAAAQVQQLAGTFSTVRATCVKTGLSENNEVEK